MRIKSALVLPVLVLATVVAFGSDSADSQHLKSLFDADQEIRSEENRKAGRAPTLQEERDRRFAVLQALAEGAPRTANDYFHSGMILHHTSSYGLDDGSLASMGSESHVLAFFLFQRAHELGHKSGRVMMGAAYNYYLRACGEDAGTYGYKFEGREIVWRPNVDESEKDVLKCGFDPRPYTE